MVPLKVVPLKVVPFKVVPLKAPLKMPRKVSLDVKIRPDLKNVRIGS